RHLAGLVLPAALVEARVRGVLLAGVMDQVDVELERVLERRRVHLRLVDRAIRLRRPPGSAEGVEYRRERRTQIAPAGLAAQADAGHLRRVDLTSGRR